VILQGSKNSLMGGDISPLIILSEMALITGIKSATVSVK
jgi:hypothetical protein